MTESVLMPVDYQTRRYKTPETSRRADNLILLRSGDVEQNPGPIIKIMMMILFLVLLLAGDVEAILDLGHMVHVPSARETLQGKWFQSNVADATRSSTRPHAQEAPCGRLRRLWLRTETGTVMTV